MIDRQAKEGGLTKEQLQQYLDKGGKITVCPSGERTENLEFKGGGFYGRNPKKKDDE